MASEKNIFEVFSHYKSMGDNEHQGVANLDPRGMIGRIYVGDNLILLHTKYLSFILSIGAWPVWTPGA